MLAQVKAGDWPAWIALAGVAAAILTYWQSRRDTKRSVAARVYLAVTAFAYSDADGTPATAFTLTNGSELPIYDAHVSLSQSGTRRWCWRWFKKRDDWWTGAWLQSVIWFALLPGHTASHTSPAIDHPPAGSTVVPPLITTFRDANGRQWVRWPNGRLNRKWKMNKMTSGHTPISGTPPTPPASPD
jgi:hypothetical protein